MLALDCLCLYLFCTIRTFFRCRWIRIVIGSRLTGYKYSLLTFWAINNLPFHIFRCLKAMLAIMTIKFDIRHFSVQLIFYFFHPILNLRHQSLLLHSFRSVKCLIVLFRWDADEVLIHSFPYLPSFFNPLISSSLFAKCG